MNNPTLIDNAQPSFGTVTLVLRIIAWSFLLFGIGGTCVSIKPLLFGKESKNWPSTSGMIDLSRIVHGSDPKSMDSAQVQYTFLVSGTAYTSSQIRYGSTHSESARSLVERYPTGRSVVVYYKPDKPSESVLETGLGLSAYIFPIFGTVFIFAGSLLWFKIPDLLEKLSARFPINQN